MYMYICICIYIYIYIYIYMYTCTGRHTISISQQTFAGPEKGELQKGNAQKVTFESKVT